MPTAQHNRGGYSAVQQRGCRRERGGDGLGWVVVVLTRVGRRHRVQGTRWARRCSARGSWARWCWVQDTCSRATKHGHAHDVGPPPALHAHPLACTRCCQHVRTDCRRRRVEQQHNNTAARHHSNTRRQTDKPTRTRSNEKCNHTRTRCPGPTRRVQGTRWARHCSARGSWARWCWVQDTCSTHAHTHTPTAISTLSACADCHQHGVAR